MNSWWDFLFLIIPFLLAAVAGKPYINLLKRLSYGQFIREDGPQAHHSKAGTPTMGGVLILLSAILGYFLLVGMGYLSNVPVSKISGAAIAVVLVALGLGALGFLDDIQKVLKRHNKGVTGYTKLAIQGVVGFGLGVYVLTTGFTQVSFFNFFQMDLGWGYPLFAMLAIMATSNAVNLTDGLDGLAGTTVVCSLMAMALLFSGFAIGPFGNTGAVYPDLAQIALAFMGGTLGFLVFNLHPAKVFMGDVGSLALGGVLAALALLGKIDFWLFLIGGIFVAEALSVILQVISYKTTGKRIFRMSPLHHHFELGGWKETKVVTVFLLVQAVLCAATVFLYNEL